MKYSNYSIVIIAILVLFLSSSLKPEKASSQSRKNTSETYGQLPMSFEPNQGQADPEVKYLARGRGYQVLLTGSEAVLNLRQSSALRLKLDGARPAGQIIGLNQLPGKTNYFIGSDPATWRINIPNYSRVEYRDVYSGVSLAFYGTQQSLEYDFIVAPGADPHSISMSVEGADKIGLDAQGDMELHIDGEVIYQRNPVIYQNLANGRQQAVTGRYVIKGRNSFGFELGNYDRARPLVIDPVLEYSTYLGGGGDDAGQSIKADTEGNAYITGVTAAADFIKKDPLQSASRGGLDAFITKINSNGTAFIYSTYLGGSGDDAGNGITVDNSGNAYVVGYTASSDFNTRNPLQSVNRGAPDAFVAKIGPDGSQLLYSTYLGGSGEEIGFAIAVDGVGNAYVTGYTSSNDFNIQSPLQPTNRGGTDAFVAKINPSGSTLSYSTYLGGTGGDLGTGIAVDATGNVYVTGYTTSSDFNTSNPFQATYRGGLDGFVAKVNTAGTALVYSTYLGGSGDDQCNSVAVDGSGAAYLTGATESADFPLKNPLQPARSGSSDAFVTKINPSGAELTFSTYLGGTGSDVGHGIAVDPAGNVYLAGDTTSNNFPTKNPIQPAVRGVPDAFIAKLNAAGAEIAFATYLGGGRADNCYGIAIDSQNNIYVTGATASLDLNVSNALQSDNLGGLDGFAAKIAADGTFFIYSTYLGGSGNDLGYGIAVDSAGNAYITGFTAAADLKVKDPLQAANRGESDAFVAKINASGSSFVYVTYLGGSALDQGLDIAVDRTGNAYVTGVTNSIDFSTRNPIQGVNRGGGDAFAARINAAGNELTYSTYLGGTGNDAAYGIALDGGGNAFLTGFTGSTNFPTLNPLQPVNRGQDDAFVAKINGAGSSLIFSTYLGGTLSETGYSIAVDGSGNACLTGVTSSTDFNTINAIQIANRGDLDAFIAKVAGDGSSLVYSTYLGGGGDDLGYGIAADAAGNAYLTGVTFSTDFNTQTPLQSTNRGNADAFVTKINAAGSTLIYSTYLGGSNSDLAYRIAADSTGNVYLTGNTASTNFPVKDAIQTTNRGRIDAFVTKIDAAGLEIVFSTYIGGNGQDEGDDIAVDGSGSIYVTGLTGSSNFPTKNAAQPSLSSGVDAFILKISAGGGGGGAPIASVSAASYLAGELATESIVAAFGVDLATSSQNASTLPLPTTLGGSSVMVRDSAGNERLAPIFSIGPMQVNYQLPPGTVTGQALVTIRAGDGKLSTGTTVISTVAPGLFSANVDGQGVAAAVALRARADGSRLFEPISQFDAMQSSFLSIPLDLGPEGEQVFLLLFGTGIRFNSNLSEVKIKIGGVDAGVSFAGAQGGFVGLDQINVGVPRSLVGRGEVDINVTVDGKIANVVKVNIK